MKNLSKANLSGKRILLRVDLNCNVFNGKIVESERIKAHSKTIGWFLKIKAKVVVIAHQGSMGKTDFISLKQHAKVLNKYVKIKFVNSTIGKKALKEISKLKPGEAILLENTRFLKEEFTPSIKNKFVKTLGPLFDYYINDAFSVSHRNHTSIVSFPKVLPHYAGPILSNELNNIRKLKSKMKNSLFILGGKKSEDLIPLLSNKRVLTGGKFSLLVLMAKGYKLGKEDRLMKKDRNLISKIKKHSKNIKAPVDLAISINGKRKVLNLDSFPQNYPVLDIGNNTIELYKKEIKKAKAIFFKGALGMFEDKEFELGTKEILKAISKSKAFSVLSGGQTSDALKKFHINKKKFGYVSLSGGALVKYLAGEKLVGLEVLR